MDKKRILVIDDDVSAARLLKLNLEKTGSYEVRDENRAAQAAVAARDFKPDLIFLDVVMPGMDGGDVASQIQADRAIKDTPIVFLTSLVGDEDEGRALVSGGFQFLAKPATTKQLVACIEKTLTQQSPAAATNAGCV